MNIFIICVVILGAVLVYGALGLGMMAVTMRMAHEDFLKDYGYRTCEYLAIEHKRRGCPAGDGCIKRKITKIGGVANGKKYLGNGQRRDHRADGL